MRYAYPPLFVCGAGISLAPPACLPSTVDIVKATLRVLLPSKTRRERLYSSLVARIQPEVLFEQASFLVPNLHTQQIWRVLRTNYSKPNIYHYLLVLSASSYRTPIVTLNFDTLLEKAADDLGLKPEVYVPRRKDRERFLTPTRVPDGKCRIWKIHGCIDTTDDNENPSLHTMMSQIGRPNRKMLRVLRQLVERCKLYIVGYSGRDGDFFPELARLSRVSRVSVPPVWIDPFGFVQANRKSLRRLNPTLWDRAEILQAHPPLIPGKSVNADLIDIVREDFPHILSELHKILGIQMDMLLRVASISLKLAGSGIDLSAHTSDYRSSDPVDLSGFATVGDLSQTAEARSSIDHDGALFANVLRCTTQKTRHCQAVEQLAFGGHSPTELEREALLVCLLFQSGHMREAYEYGRTRMDEFQQKLPPRLASAVTLYFSRLCDWNSKYDAFLHFASTAGKLADQMVEPALRRQRLLVQCGVECLSTRAISMRFGPAMKWPNQSFSFGLSLKEVLILYHRSARGSFRLRKLLAGFGVKYLTRMGRVFFPQPPGPTAHPEEAVAWQYYLDHRQVFLNYLIRFLAKAVDINCRSRLMLVLTTPVKKISKFCARMALWNLTRLVRRAGAATIQADIYLFRARYGIANDLAFADHFWSLVSNPVGGALVLRDRGIRSLKAALASRSTRVQDSKKLMEARQQFFECYALSSACGSHLTALKALIGLFHTGYAFRKTIWDKHVNGIEGQQHVSFFNGLTAHIASHNGFKPPRRIKM
jgi:SIR2-like domain